MVKNTIAIDSPLNKINIPPEKENPIIDQRFFSFVISKKKNNNNIIKNTCKDIEDIWLHAYKCKGIIENSIELKKLILLEKKFLFSL